MIQNNLDVKCFFLNDRTTAFQFYYVSCNPRPIFWSVKGRYILRRYIGRDQSDLTAGRRLKSKPSALWTVSKLSFLFSTFVTR